MKKQFLLWIIALLLLSCKSNDCADACIQGECVDAQCQCPLIYELEHCETQARDKFIRSIWYNRNLCGSTGSFLESYSRSGTIDGELFIYNVHAQGDSVRAVAHRDTLIVPIQAYGFDYINGVGLYGNESFTLEYTISTTVGAETACVSVFGR